jgi:hypothetical protein
MDSTASSFTLRKNAKRAAEAMIRKGTAPAVDYGIKPSENGRFEIVWKIAKAAPTTDEVEIKIAEASAVQPVAASLTEAASQPAPSATEPARALSEPEPKSEWPHGTRVMVFPASAFERPPSVRLHPLASSLWARSHRFVEKLRPIARYALLRCAQLHSTFSNLHRLKILDRILLLEEPLRERDSGRPALGPYVVQRVGSAEFQ